MFCLVLIGVVLVWLLGDGSSVFDFWVYFIVFVVGELLVSVGCVVLVVLVW